MDNPGESCTDAEYKAGFVDAEWHADLHLLCPFNARYFQNSIPTHNLPQLSWNLHGSCLNLTKVWLSLVVV